MDLQEAVRRWAECDYGTTTRCLGEKKCANYILVDPRRRGKKGLGPGPSGKRTLCGLLDDLDEQIRTRTGS